MMSKHGKNAFTFVTSRQLVVKIGQLKERERDEDNSWKRNETEVKLIQCDGEAKIMKRRGIQGKA